MHPSEVVVPLKVTNTDGEEFEVLECQTSILWPWDFLTWMWDSGVFLQWIADDPASAHQRNREYWQQCAHLDFYKRLEMTADQHDFTVPLFVHADGVKIYKNQKGLGVFNQQCKQERGIYQNQISSYLAEGEPHHQREKPWCYWYFVWVYHEQHAFWKISSTRSQWQPFWPKLSRSW